MGWRFRLMTTTALIWSAPSTERAEPTSRNGSGHVAPEAEYPMTRRSEDIGNVHSSPISPSALAKSQLRQLRSSRRYPRFQSGSAVNSQSKRRSRPRRRTALRSSRACAASAAVRFPGPVVDWISDP